MYVALERQAKVMPASEAARVDQLIYDLGEKIRTEFLGINVQAFAFIALGTDPKSPGVLQANTSFGGTAGALMHMSDMMQAELDVALHHVGACTCPRCHFLDIMDLLEYAQMSGFLTEEQKAHLASVYGPGSEAKN